MTLNYFQFRNVSRVLVEKLNSSTPLKISGRHLDSVSVHQSYLGSVPWPGIFLFNATTVSITHSLFPGLVPKSISLSLGEEVTVSHNLLDVSTALNMLQYQHINIKCNRRSLNETLSPDCLDPPVLEKGSEHVDAALEDEAGGVLIVPEPKLEDQGWILSNDTVILTALLVNDIYGTLFIALASLLTVCFLVLFCIRSAVTSRRKPAERKGITDLIKGTSSLGTRLLAAPGGEGGGDGDEYSNSSRAHLAQGVDGDPRRLRYVTVQGVRSEEGEGGIVCGSLTLGPAYTVNGSSPTSTRAASSNRLKNQTFSKI